MSTSTVTPDRSLPEGWRKVSLGNVCRVFAGGAAPQGEIYFNSNGPFFFRVSDLGNYGRTMDLSEARDRLSPEALENCQLVPARKGTVLFPKSGAAVATNNRAMLAVDGYIVSHLMALEPNDDVLAAWLYHAVCTMDMIDYSDNTGYPSLKQSVAQQIEIPLPPLSEQRRLVALLEERMTAVDRARRAAEDTIEQIDALKNAFLRDVFQVGDDLPQGWRWVTLGEVCDVTGGSTPDTNNHSYWSGEIAWVTPTDLGKLSGKTITKTDRYITPVGLDSCSAQMLPVNTVIMSSRAPIGHLAIAGINLCTNQGCKGFVPNPNVDSLFLYWALKQYVPNFQSLGSGATFTEISKSALQGFEIPLPPLSEQRRLVALLEERMTEVERARAAACAQLDTINALPSAWQRLAFAGEI